MVETIRTDFYYFTEKHPNWSYWIMMMFMLSSGSNWFKHNLEYRYVILAPIFFLYIIQKGHIRKQFNDLWVFSIFMIVLYLGQWFVFGWNTFRGCVNYSAMIVCAAFLMKLFDYNLKEYYYKVLSHLSLFGLPFWLIKVTTGQVYSLVGEHDLFFYFSRVGEDVRNCGSFWEPGAYGCYLTILLLLYVNEVPNLWRCKNKRRFVVIILSVFSTMSTTTYLSVSAFFALYFFFKMKHWSKYPLLALFFIGFGYLYTNVEFLSEKINHQNEMAYEAQGDYDYSRLGSFLFDMSYVEKHPLVGNGLNERTLYADHQWLVQMWEDGEMAKNGNGFSNQMAKFGVFFFPVFFYFFYRNNREIDFRSKAIFTIVLCMLLFGEPLLNYPFCLGVPFMKLVRR